MAVMLRPKLKLRSLIPVFQLMSADGRAVNIWDYKSRKNMVLAFLPASDCPECVEFLRSASNMYHRYEEENAVLLLIVRGGVESATALYDKLHPPFPILYDEIGEVTRRYTDVVPAVFVADKFGELYAQWIVGPDGFLPTQKEILDVVELINLECPE